MYCCRSFPRNAALALMLMTGPAMAQTSSSSPAPSFATQQPANERLASLFFGQNVTNTTGEVVGNINDLLFDNSGRITTVVIGVGGFLGAGEKNVAIPFASLAVTANATGERTVIVPLSKAALENAPDFKATEKSLLTIAGERASELGTMAKEKAVELRDKMGKKIEELRKDEPKK